MAVMTDVKKAALISLLGPVLAARVLAQAEATEKQADDLKLKYKERRENLPFAGAPSFNLPAGTGIGDFVNSGK